MPLLPPPEPPLVPGAAPLVVQTRGDVLAVLPPRYKQALSAPIRDALADSLLALLKECQYRGGYAAAQRDIGRANGEYLDGQVEDYLSARAEGEDDESVRTRTLQRSSGVSFDKIREAVNLILAPFTAVECQIADSVLDRLFLGGSAARSWHSFLGRTPNYPSRLYEHDVANAPSGVFKAGTDPGGALLFGSPIGRMFLLRVPDLNALDAIRAHIYNQSALRPQVRGLGMYLGGGGSSVNTSFVSNGATALTVYLAIKNTVDSLVGHSIRWVMLSDTKLG